MRNRSAEFSDELQDLAHLAKALSHPARVQIVQKLAESGACICQQIVTDPPLSQASISQHLKVLKEAGLIRGEIDGPRVCYCVTKEGFSQLRDCFDRFIGETIACCD